MRRSAMAKAAIVVLADTNTPADLSRVVSALTAARGLAESGQEVTVVFDGAGTKWVPELCSHGHKYADLFSEVSPHVAGACAYCAWAFGVAGEVEANGVDLLGDHDRHEGLEALTGDGYQLVTF
jgi:hypothetical protein